MVYRAFRLARLKSRKFDCNADDRYNICLQTGVYSAIDLILDVLPLGLITWAPPCAMFVFMSSNVHKRTKSKPLGNVKNISVQLANIIVDNMAFLMQLATRRRLWQVLEQPFSSLMYAMPALKRVIKKWKRIYLHMGAFGHAMLKPTLLYGTLPSLGDLAQQVHIRERVRSKSGTKHVRKTGKMLKKDSKHGLLYHFPAVNKGKSTMRKITGGPGLKSSAAYPYRFGQSLRVAWKKDFVDMSRSVQQFLPAWLRD